MSVAKEALDGDYKSRILPLFIKQEQESKHKTWKGLRMWLNMVIPVLSVIPLIVMVHDKPHNSELWRDDSKALLAELVMCCMLYLSTILLIFGPSFEFLELQKEDENNVRKFYPIGKWPMVLWILYHNLVSKKYEMK